MLPVTPSHVDRASWGTQALADESEADLSVFMTAPLLRTPKRSGIFRVVLQSAVQEICQSTQRTQRATIPRDRGTARAPRSDWSPFVATNRSHGMPSTTRHRSRGSADEGPRPAGDGMIEPCNRHSPEDGFQPLRPKFAQVLQSLPLPPVRIRVSLSASATLDGRVRARLVHGSHGGVRCQGGVAGTAILCRSWIRTQQGARSGTGESIPTDAVTPSTNCVCPAFYAAQHELCYE